MVQAPEKVSLSQPSKSALDRLLRRKAERQAPLRGAVPQYKQIGIKQASRATIVVMLSPTRRAERNRLPAVRSLWGCLDIGDDRGYAAVECRKSTWRYRDGVRYLPEVRYAVMLNPPRYLRDGLSGAIAPHVVSSSHCPEVCATTEETTGRCVDGSLGRLGQGSNARCPVPRSVQPEHRGV